MITSLMKDEDVSVCLNHRFVSFFAPFLLILQGIRNTIGCKSETIKDDLIFAGKVMSMHQREMERLAFLCLCGKRDRALLMGKEEMTFSDLERLTYLMDFLGLDEYNLEIWNEYAERFAEQFAQLEQLEKENDRISDVSWDLSEADEELHDQWIKKFCRQVPDAEMRKELKEFVKRRQECD